MKPNDIKDRKSLEEWLEPYPFAQAQAIATRTALRVAPILFSELEGIWAKHANISSLIFLRELLVSSVSRKFQTREVASAAFAASADHRVASYVLAEKGLSATALAISAAISTAYATNAAVDGASRAAASSADAAEDVGASSQIWEQVREDARQIEAGENPFARRLWSIPDPPWFHEFDIRARAIWAKDPETWSFWLRWWDGVLSGNQLDWDLQRQVALIPDDIWHQGPAAVAEVIRQIELDFAIARTLNAEIIELNPETGLFRSVPDSRLPADHLRDVTRKIADAADVFGGLEQTDNRYTAARPDIDYLRKRLERDRTNPRALYDLSRSVSQRLAARVRDQSLPPDDPLVEDCIRQLDEAAIDIVGFDEKTRQVVENRAAVRLARLDPEAMPDVVSRSDQAARLVEGELVQSIPDDARTILDPNATAEARAAATYSTISRFSRILAWYRSLGTKEKVLTVGAGLVVAAGGANTLFDFFGNLWPVLQWLWAAIF